MQQWYLFFDGEILLTSQGAIPTGVLPPVANRLLRTSFPITSSLFPNPTQGHCAQLTQRPSFDDAYQLVSLRASFDLLSITDYRRACRARQLLHWDEQTQYCGACGHITSLTDTHTKTCHHCHRQWWPTITPAVITLVTRPSASGNSDDDEILLVHGKNFPGNYFSLVAGFVEVDEELEEAVAREVREETGIRIKNIRYFGSAPWAYPSVLMVGFFAEYKSGEFVLQEDELIEGGWFKRSQLPTLTGQVSLARKMIDAWLSSSLTNP